MHDPTNRREFLKKTTLASAGFVLGTASAHDGLEKTFRAGAAAVDATPTTLPVINSGGFLQRTAGTVHGPLFARCLVLDDGKVRLAICVVDNLMMPREMLDDVKLAASRSTGIPTDRMLISATHTHSAPSVMGALGTGVDRPYAELLPGRIIESIEQAAANLAPAQIGWAVVDNTEDTNCRVWIRRPDRIGVDPFGDSTIRAMMHPGYENPDYIGPCGPEDPGLSVLAVRSPAGSPIALVANYSMHYFGAPAVSPDYFGPFCEKVKTMSDAESSQPPFVAIMSHGTSGDQHWMDYSQPRKSINLDSYAQHVANAAVRALESIEYQDWVSLAMAEAKLTIGRRLPSEERLAWAVELVAAMGDRVVPNSQQEVYALEQTYLAAEPERELILQALRIGQFGLTAIPCEVYAITGLKLKAQSPLESTMNVELANGGEGYIPPPELHPFGGYNTWPARTAGLEPQAEPQIVETLLGLLEKVAGQPRRVIPEADDAHARAVRVSKPTAYWPLDEIAGRSAKDISGSGHEGRYEDLIALYLEGPDAPAIGVPNGTGRAAHFAGGRVAASIEGLGETYSLGMWFWNGLPSDARAVAGYLFSRGSDAAQGAPGDNLGIGGTHRDGVSAGRLIFFNGDEADELVIGRSVIEAKTWNHVVLVRDGRNVSVHLNGGAEPEFSGTAAVTRSANCSQVFLGGRSDSMFNFQGKICRVALYNRALSPEEIAIHYEA